jgi:hypothetical protein
MTRPDPARRREFLDRLSRPAAHPRRRILSWSAVAAAALIGILIVALQPSAPVVTPPAAGYRHEVTKETLARLKTLSETAPPDGPLVDDVVAIETSLIEEALARQYPPVEVSLAEAPQALTSPDVARRAAAYRALAAAPREKLAAIQVSDAAAARYVRALLRATPEETPRAEGKPVKSSQHSVVVKGQLRELRFAQYENGVVYLRVREGDPSNPTVTEVIASDLLELTAKHPEVCKRYGIQADGGIVIKSSRRLHHDVAQVRDEVTRDVLKALEKLEGLKIDAFARQAARAKGDEAEIRAALKEYEQAMRKAELDEKLRSLRDRATADEIRAAAELEKAYQRSVQLQIFCDRLKSLGK